jgi:hypothetical protein
VRLFSASARDAAGCPLVRCCSGPLFQRRSRYDFGEKEKGREGESTSDTSFGKVEDPRRFISWMKRENNRSIEYLTGGIERLTRA